MDFLSPFDDMTPQDLDLPAKFDDFRQIQRDAATFALFGRDGGAGKRFRMLGVPTGAGKSVLAEMVGIASGVRYVILTATKGLQDQRVEDGFDSVDVRGRANYQCAESRIGKYQSCADGEENGCALCYTEHCTYGGVVGEAKRARGVSTNYAYWMAARGQNSQALETPGSPVGLLIMDETHLSIEQLSRHLAAWIGREDLARFTKASKVRDVFKGLKGADWAFVGEKWIHLLGDLLVGIEVEMGRLAEGYESRAQAAREEPEFRRLDKLSGDVNRVVQLGEGGNWIWHPGRNGQGIKFDCVWPYKYAERYLFSGVERVVGMSATLRPKCMSLLGIKRKDYDYKEWPRVFPPHLSPVYYWPVGRLGKKATEEDRAAAYKAVDDIWLARRDRKMIVHTVSYDRAVDFQRECVEAGRAMILSDREQGSAMRAATRFRAAGPGAVLCSPSFVTGWDFPLDSAEVNVIPKLPFNSLADPVVQARKSDPSFEVYDVAQGVQQAAGRATRTERDRSEVFLTDRAYGWFRYAAKEHFSLGWRVIEIKEIPKCPPKL